MQQQNIIRRCVTAILSGIALGAFAASAAAQSKVQSIPPVSDVQKAVWQDFQKQDDFQPGDLSDPRTGRAASWPTSTHGLAIGRCQANPGESLPAKDDFLVQQLRTRAGKKFMRRIAADPNAYDRLDRLSRMPHGQQTIRDLIKGPGGENLIDYMTKTPGGAALGQMLPRRPTATISTLPQTASIRLTTC